MKRTGLVGTCRGICSLAVGNERNDATLWEGAAGDGVNESLKVRTKARGHDCNAAW